MSWQQRQKPPQKQLTQEQSKIADNLPWSEEQTKWIETRTGKKFPLKYKYCSFDDAGLEAVQMFHGLGLAEKEKVKNFAGIYEYGVGRDRLFKNNVKTESSWTPERKQQWQQDTASEETTTVVSSVGTTPAGEDKWDKIRSRQEERDKEFETRHKESMEMLRVVDDGNRKLTDAINGLIRTINQNRGQGLE